MEVDHIFICSKLDAPEADELNRFGLTEGGGNQHPGQGTANRRFFFHNAFIECLWLTNASEAQSDLTRPTMLYERLTQPVAGISPFGVCFRPTNAAQLDPPFPTWSYRPTYLPEGLSIEIASTETLGEPMWFFFAMAGRPDSSSPSQRQPMQHRCSFKELTSLRITIPNIDNLSLAALVAQESAGIDFVAGDCQHIEIGFDHLALGQSHCLLPKLPLTFIW